MAPECMLDETVATVTLNIKAALVTGTLRALFSPHPINSTIEVDYLVYVQAIYCWQLQKAVLRKVFGLISAMQCSPCSLPTRMIW